MQIVIGAGQVGLSVAKILSARGEEVRVISRRGGGPNGIAADASDPDRLAALTKGASAIYNCAAPPYDRWLTDLPPLSAAIIHAAVENDAVLATANNLYGYGQVAGPMTEQTPLAATHPKLRLRAKMWEDAVASGARVTEVRSGDYIGPGARSVLTEAVLNRTLAGKPAFVWGDPDAPHTWSDVDDVARTLVTIAGDERAWGKPWHVPSAEPMPTRQIAELANSLAGIGKPKLTKLSYPAFLALGLIVKPLREQRITYYQLAAPFVMDSTLAQETFGLTPTPIEQSLARSKSDSAERD